MSTNFTRKAKRVATRIRWFYINIIDNISVRSEKLICPICNFQGFCYEFSVYESQCIFKGGKLVRHKCPSCGVIFGTQRMLALSEAELSKEYKSHYSCYDELGDSTEKEVEAFYLLNPQKNGTYLNFGCGRWNKTIEKMRSLGYDIYGFEPYSSITDNQFIINDFDTLSSMEFDGIISNDLLEHLRYPDKALILMASLLKKEGSMVHRTPCFKYACERTRFHLYFFTGDSLREICHKASLSYSDTDLPDIKIFNKLT
jgi:Methyltransferase domain